MTHVADHCIAGPFAGPERRLRRAAPAPRQVRSRDARWPAVVAALATLRAARRSSVRIIDADCGAGALLLCAVRYARALGFTAIEARGIDDAPALVGRAKVSAADLHDAAIGISFETSGLIDALDEEAEFPADIVLWHSGNRWSAAEARAVAHAGNMLIADPECVA